MLGMCGLCSFKEKRQPRRELKEDTLKRKESPKLIPHDSHHFDLIQANIINVMKQSISNRDPIYIYIVFVINTSYTFFNLTVTNCFIVSVVY